MKKFCLLVLLIGFTFGLSSCKDSTVLEDYVQLTDNDHIIRYTTGEEVVSLFENDYSGIIVFSFPSCPWCQAACPYINEIAKENLFDEVLMLDIKEMRNNPLSTDRKYYLDILGRLKEPLGIDDKIYAPTVIVLKNGEVTGYNVGTVDDHQIVEQTLPPMTADQISRLKDIYRNIFKK